MASVPDIKIITAELFHDNGLVIDTSPVYDFNADGVQKTNKEGIPLYTVTVIIHGAGAKVKIASKEPLGVKVGDVVNFENLSVGQWAMSDKKSGFFYSADAVTIIR